MASTSGHKRNGSSSSMFAHKHTESGGTFIGQKRHENGHKRAESISSSFGIKKTDGSKKNEHGFGHRRLILQQNISKIKIDNLLLILININFNI